MRKIFLSIIFCFGLLTLAAQNKVYKYNYVCTYVYKNDKWVYVPIVYNPSIIIDKSNKELEIYLGNTSFPKRIILYDYISENSNLTLVNSRSITFQNNLFGEGVIFTDKCIYFLTNSLSSTANTDYLFRLHKNINSNLNKEFDFKF